MSDLSITDFRIGEVLLNVVIDGGKSYEEMLGDLEKSGYKDNRLLVVPAPMRDDCDYDRTPCNSK